LAVAADHFITVLYKPFIETGLVQRDLPRRDGGLEPLILRAIALTDNQ
jgi:hypothetical protein